MTTFTKVWALKSDTMLTTGSVVDVSLKNGSTKKVIIGAYLGAMGDKYLFATEKKDTN